MQNSVLKVYRRNGGIYLDKNITIITDPEGKKIVLINDIRFKGKNGEKLKIT